MLKKTTLQEIKHSLGRYIAIIAIVALGIGFFAGLKITRSDMVSTADDYLKEENLFDYELVSTLGFEDEDIENISNGDGVTTAEGCKSADIIFSTEGDIDRVCKVYSLPSKINKLQLIAGRLPSKENECIVDANYYTDAQIGETVLFSSDNSKSDLDNFKYKEYTIVGVCNSPLYLNYERGTSSLGNGTISTFMYIPDSGFKMDYYTSVYVDLKTKGEIYSDKYNSYISSYEDSMEELCQASADRRYNSVISKAKEDLDKAKSEYEDAYNTYVTSKNDAYSKLDDAYSKITSGKESLAKEEKNLKTKKSDLEKSKEDVIANQELVETSLAQLEAGKAAISEEEYLATKSSLESNKIALSDSLSQIEAGLGQISSYEKTIEKSKEELSQNEDTYYENKRAADEEFANAKKELDDAKVSIEDGEKELKKISKPSTYVLDRETNIGYVCFENDSGLIDGIAKVFPLFFFLVAALVCMTTMTRMVDEQRTQIGVFKALGYSNAAIIGEYLFYSGSAGTIGTILGFFGGSYLFPKVIWTAYGMMYSFDNTLHYIYDLRLGTLSLAAALLCSMGSTYISCRNDFSIVPAQLIRPKAPKSGKEILLEKIKPLWNRISFMYKVTLRNIFRYKKRFFMMVLGISGCTALLVTGFGVNDSVKNIVDFQYDEIMTFDYSVNFHSALDKQDMEDFISDSADNVSSVYFLSQSTVDLVAGSKEKSVNLITSNADDIKGFIDLHDKTGPLKYPSKGEAVICNELADRYSISKGDKITIRDSDRNAFQVTVSGICQNYIYNYIYITPETYQDGFGSAPEYKTAFIKAADNSREGVSESSTKIQKLDNVMGTSVNNDMRDRVNNMMTSMDAVILLVILSAGALAFIVLYNLTNINITERIREIATIKVLGFYPYETSAYVFRENFILTGISAAIGLFLGKLLHGFVMSQLKIDLISFDTRIVTMSYVWSFLLTFLFAVIVSIAMYFKLNKISMTESLKSIE